MAEIPRVYAQQSAELVPVPRPNFENTGADVVFRALREQEKEEENLRLQQYDIEVQTALRDTLVEARTKAAETTDPEEYQRVYESILQKGFDPLQATVGNDPKRGLILNRRFNEQIRSESDNIAAGVLNRKRAISIVNAQKALTLAVDRTLEAPDEISRKEERLQFGLDVDRMVGLSEVERNKLKQEYLVQTTAQSAVKRAQAGDALGAIKDIEKGVYKDLDIDSRKAVKSEINSYLNELQTIGDRQRQTDKRVFLSKLDAMILDKKPNGEIAAFIRQGVENELISGHEVAFYEGRALGKEGKDTPEQTANFHEFRARFMAQSYTAAGLAKFESEARQMWQEGQLGNVGYGNLGSVFRQTENFLDIKARRGATGGEGGGKATYSGYDQAVTRIRQAYLPKTGEFLARDKDFQRDLTELNQRIQEPGANIKQIADDIVNRRTKEMQQKKADAKVRTDQLKKEAEEKAKGGVDPTKLNQIQGLAR